MGDNVKRGLVVEDLPDARAWLADALRSGFDGIDVGVAGNCSEARAYVDQHQPDVALIDLGLPDEPGVSFISHLTRVAPQCMCVVATVFDDDQHLFSALRAGAQGYVLKDQSQTDIVAMLRGIAEGRPPLSPSIAQRLMAFFRDDDQPESPLSPREQEVLALIAKGYTIPKVAELLGIAASTAASYVRDIYRKLDVSSRAEATLEAARLGLVNP